MLCDTESIRGSWFAVEQGIRPGWVLAPLLFKIFLAAFMNAAYTRFMAEKTSWTLWCTSGREQGRGGEGGQPMESQPWGHGFEACSKMMIPESPSICQSRPGR